MIDNFQEIFHGAMLHHGIWLLGLMLTTHLGNILVLRPGRMLLERPSVPQTIPATITIQLCTITLVFGQELLSPLTSLDGMMAR